MIDEVTTIAGVAKDGGGWVIFSLFVAALLYILREYFTGLIKAQEKKNDKEEIRRDKESEAQKQFLSSVVDKMEGIAESNREANILLIKSLGHSQQVLGEVKEINNKHVPNFIDDHQWKKKHIQIIEEIVLEDKKKSLEILRKTEEIHPKLDRLLEEIKK